MPSAARAKQVVKRIKRRPSSDTYVANENKLGLSCWPKAILLPSKYITDERFAISYDNIVDSAHYKILNFRIFGIFLAFSYPPY